MFDDEEYPSGPYCIHYSDPSDCEELCICGHKCSEHLFNDECSECDCKEYKDK